MAFKDVGTFIAKPVSWGTREGQKSESVAISIEWIPEEIFEEGKEEGDPGKFVPYENTSGETVVGDIWIFGADGTPIKSAIQQTMKDTLGWSGEFEDLEPGGKFKPPRCQITVEMDTYKGITNCKVAWVNPIGGRPIKKPDQLTEENTKTLKSKYGDNIQQIMRGDEPTPF